MTFSAFDVIGPVMVGPSSSHTAGAVRIGLAARSLIGTTAVSAEIELHGSFADTGKGHATDRALAAGLLGYAPDDEQLEHSLQRADESGILIHFRKTDLGEDAHPNATRIKVVAPNRETHQLIGWSVGGGSILIKEIDGFKTTFSGSMQTLLIWHKDCKGFLAKVTTLFECADTNIATIQLSRSARGANALTVIESDSALSKAALKMIRGLSATEKIVQIPPDWISLKE